jgi:hypothetical protein
MKGAALYSFEYYAFFSIMRASAASVFIYLTQTV